MDSDRRRLIAGTALHVLATAGGRGLTHRAVDAAASLPAGSTSYYFRTRSALLHACLDDVLVQDLADLDLMQPLVSAADADALEEALADVVVSWLTTGRERHLARFELSLEALRRPDLAELLHHGREALRVRVAESLASLDVADAAERAEWLVACIDGIVFDRITGAHATAPVRRGEILSMVRRLGALK